MKGRQTSAEFKLQLKKRKPQINPSKFNDCKTYTNQSDFSHQSACFELISRSWIFTRNFDLCLHERFGMSLNAYITESK